MKKLMEYKAILIYPKYLKNIFHLMKIKEKWNFQIGGNIHKKIW